VPHEVREASPDQQQWELLDAGLLVERGRPGVYGHGEAFERVREPGSAPPVGDNRPQEPGSAPPVGDNRPQQTASA
jgi:hypothetical protein